MNPCHTFLANKCNFTDSSCWYNHNIGKKQDVPEVNSGKNSDVSKPASQPPFFWDPPANLAPPPTQPTQATWLKMVSMMDNLNMMMKAMKESSQFL